MVKISRGRLVCGALGVLLALFEAGAVTSVAARSPMNHLQHLRFSGAVALPGVTLPAGEYTFVVNIIDAGNVVQVRERATGKGLFVGSTLRATRPRSLAEGVSITFLEAAREAMPIRAWYPPDARIGYEFLYPGR